MPLLRILAARGTEYCDKTEHHKNQIYLTVEDITKVRSTQTNDMCERLHKTMKDEFYNVAFRKKYIIHLKCCSKIWMFSLSIIIKYVQIVEPGVMARLQHILLQNQKY